MGELGRTFPRGVKSHGHASSEGADWSSRTCSCPCTSTRFLFSPIAGWVSLTFEEGVPIYAGMAAAFVKLLPWEGRKRGESGGVMEKLLVGPFSSPLNELSRCLSSPLHASVH